MNSGSVVMGVARNTWNKSYKKIPKSYSMNCIWGSKKEINKIDLEQTIMSDMLCSEKGFEFLQKEANCSGLMWWLVNIVIIILDLDIKEKKLAKIHDRTLVQ